MVARNFFQHCLTFLPGSAWVLLSKICKDFFSALYRTYSGGQKTLFGYWLHESRRRQQFQQYFREITSVLNSKTQRANCLVNLFPCKCNTLRICASAKCPLSDFIAKWLWLRERAQGRKQGFGRKRKSDVEFSKFSIFLERFNAFMQACISK